MRVTATVAIPTRNRRARLIPLLELLIPQAANVGAEILVVDNGSSDGTVEAVRRLEGDTVRCIVEPGAGATRARNAAARAARGEVAAFTDGDTASDTIPVPRSSTWWIRHGSTPRGSCAGRSGRVGARGSSTPGTGRCARLRGACAGTTAARCSGCRTRPRRGTSATGSPRRAGGARRAATSSRSSVTGHGGTAEMPSCGRTLGLFGLDVEWRHQAERGAVKGCCVGQILLGIGRTGGKVRFAAHTIRKQREGASLARRWEE